MTPQQVIDFFGTQEKTAQALGIRQPSVSDWVTNGKVPPGRQFEIEIRTNGQLKADPELMKCA